ncbi:MAG TPA: MATE family efflux transporter [Acidimicrobiales bacterium]|nr:MATE family efflux transporter [Acidimicrobiales bacterium]
MATAENRVIDRRLFSLAVPALFTLAAEPVYVLVDTAIVGHLGTAPLGGLALAGTVLTTAIALCNALSWGTTTRVGNLIGAGDRAGAGRVAMAVLWLSLGVGVPLALALIAASRILPALLGGEGAVLEAAATYLGIGALGVPAVLVAMAGQGVCRGHGDMRTPLTVVVAANVANVIIEIVFVYGLDLGIAGSAWGTVIVQWLAAAVFGWLLLRTARAVGVPARPHVEEMRGLGRIAGDLAIRTGALLAVLAAATSVAARINPTALAAHQIALQLTLFLAFVLDATAIAAQTLVATELGAGNPAAAWRIARRAVRVTTQGSIGIAVVVLAGRHAFPALFTDDRAAINAAAAILPIVAAMQIPGAVAFVLDGVLMGAGDYRTVMWSTVIGLVVFVAPAAWVVTGGGSGLVSLWLGLAGWMTARAIVNARGQRARQTSFA